MGPLSHFCGRNTFTVSNAKGVTGRSIRLSALLSCDRGPDDGCITLPNWLRCKWYIRILDSSPALTIAWIADGGLQETVVLPVEVGCAANV